MESKKLLIIGSGGHGRSVADCATASRQWDQICFADDQYERLQIVNGFKIVGKLKCFIDLAPEFDGVVVAIGNNKVRAGLIEQCLQHNLPLASVVHPKAIISPFAKIKAGCTIMAGSVVGANASLGYGCIVNAMACLDHDVELGNFVHIGVGVNAAGGVAIGEGATLQVGVSLGCYTQIKAWELVNPGETMVSKRPIQVSAGKGTSS